MNPQPPSAPPPLPASRPAPPLPQQHVVHVVAKRGGFGRAVGFVIGLFAFALVFLFGLSFGILGTSMSAAFEGYLPETTYRGGDRSTITIIPIEGEIDSTMAWFVRYAVDQVLEDTSVRAVVLRVDSGGGGVTASDQIWNQIERLKRARGGRGIPIVASYGGIAASGGYYVSCAADHIVAEETCITGSIGVIAQALTFGELFEKVGVKPVTLIATDSPQKDVANNTYREWNDRDREVLVHMLDSSYDLFRRRVADGRGDAFDTEGDLAGVADGSIFTAAEAKENGLIDSIGYLDDAIREAERQAKLPLGRATVRQIIRPFPSLVEMLLGEADQPAARSRLTWLEAVEQLDADRLRALMNELSRPRVMYLMQ